MATEVVPAFLQSCFQKLVADALHAFVALRRIMSIPDTTERFNLIEKEIAFIKSEMEDTLEIQNDINESTRAQLDAISTAQKKASSPMIYAVTVFPLKIWKFREKYLYLQSKQ